MTRVTAILVLLLFATACSGDSDPQPTPEVVAVDSIPGVYELLGGGITISDYSPSSENTLPLKEAVAELEASGLRVLSGALIGVVWHDALGGDIGYLYPERLVWAVEVDPSASEVPELFPPTASTSLALVDAHDGTVQTVYTR
jgi:hypothetical protein